MLEFNPIKSLGYGVYLDTVDANTLNLFEILKIKSIIYKEKIVVLKNQNLSPKEFVRLGKRLGAFRAEDEEMFPHREGKPIFVSSNIPKNNILQRVSKTESFWHSDYAFMPNPFAITMVYPEVIPNVNRGTYFIDMAQVYKSLSKDLKKKIAKTTCQHSIKKYNKNHQKGIYHSDQEILNEIAERTPTVVTHPTVVVHPVTKKKILYISEEFTIGIQGLKEENEGDKILKELLEFSGQLDKTFSNPFIKLLEIEKDDIILWDNRRLIHHVKHSALSEPAKSFHVTVYDDFPFSREKQLKEEHCGYGFF